MAPAPGPADREQPVGPHPDGACVRVRVVPGARRSEVAGVALGALRVRVAAPAVEGRANAALLELLAGRLGLRSRQLRIASGERGRDKLVVVAGRSPEQVRAALVQ